MSCPFVVWAVQQRKKKRRTFTCCQLTPVGCLSIAVYSVQPSVRRVLKAFIYPAQVRQSQLAGEMHDKGHDAHFEYWCRKKKRTVHPVYIYIYKIRLLAMKPVHRKIFKASCLYFESFTVSKILVSPTQFGRGSTYLICGDGRGSDEGCDWCLCNHPVGGDAIRRGVEAVKEK